MKVNKNYEAELSLKDFLFHILYKWRIILLIGLIAAGILGFREYWSFEKYHRNGELTPEEAQYEADIAALDSSFAQVETDIAGYQKLIDEKSNYRNTSILMKIDPTAIWTAEKEYRLNLDGSPDDHTHPTLTALSEAFYRDLPAETLLEVFGTANRNDINETACIAVNRYLLTVSAIGCGSTEEEAVRRKELVDSCLQETMRNLQQTKVFTLDVLSDSVGTRTTLLSRNLNADIVEKDLASMQDVVNEEIKNYQNKQQQFISKRNELNGKVYVKPRANVVGQAVLGLVLGAFLAILVLTVMYLFNGKLKTARELRNRYDVPVIGEFTRSRAWWKGKGLDWVLEKMEFGKKTVPDNELDGIASLLNREKDGETVLLTGTLPEKEMKNAFEGLSARLKEKGMTLVLQPEYLRNSEAVKTALKADTVILAEERYRSKVSDLNRMAEMLTIENAKILGVILL